MSASHPIPLPTSRRLLRYKLRLEPPPFLGAPPNPLTPQSRQPCLHLREVPQHAALSALSTSPAPTVCPGTRGRTWSSGHSGPQAKFLPSLGTGVMLIPSGPVIAYRGGNRGTEQPSSKKSAKCGRQARAPPPLHAPFHSVPQEENTGRDHTEAEGRAVPATEPGSIGQETLLAKAGSPAGPPGALRHPRPGRAYPRWAFGAVSRQDRPPWCSHG